MNTVQILKDARALIADEKSWTRGAYAFDERGKKQVCPNQHSVCFCSVGALARAARVSPGDIERSEVVGAILSVGNFEEVGHLVEFNDSHSHAEVLALFDRAIARAESEAA